MEDIIGFEGYYQVDRDGNVYSIRKGITLKPCVVKDGVHKVALNKEGVKKSKAIHRLVAEAFLPNPQNKPQVDHRDGDKSNNAVTNLRWCTNIENQMFREEQGNSGKESVSKTVTWGDKVFKSIGEAARYIANIRGSKVDTVKKELKAARYGDKVLYGELTVIGE